MRRSRSGNQQRLGDFKLCASFSDQVGEGDLQLAPDCRHRNGRNEFLAAEDAGSAELAFVQLGGRCCIDKSAVGGMSA